jgi:hypothetical protein
MPKTYCSEVCQVLRIRCLISKSLSISWWCQSISDTLINTTFSTRPCRECSSNNHFSSLLCKYDRTTFSDCLILRVFTIYSSQLSIRYHYYFMYTEKCENTRLYHHSLPLHTSNVYKVYILPIQVSERSLDHNIVLNLYNIWYLYN